MALGINQFAMTPVQGEMDLSVQGSVITARVSPNQDTALIAGQPVKWDTAVNGGVPAVKALAANTDVTFGFVARNIKDATRPTNSNLELAQFNSCMYMTAGAAITRGASVEVVYTTNKVITSAGVNPVVGYALDNAAADGDLIRVVIQAPYSAPASNLTGRAQTIIVSATLAEINAGKVLIPGITGQKITVSNIVNRVTGTFATGTSVILQSTNGTPVNVITYAEAAIAGTTVLVPGAANTTLNAGYGAQLGTGDGLQVVNNGSAQTGGTSMQFTIDFTQA